MSGSYGTLPDFIAFFIHNWWPDIYVVSLPNCHRLCVQSLHKFGYVEMLDVTTSYGRSSGFIYSLEILMFDTFT